MAMAALFEFSVQKIFSLNFFLQSFFINRSGEGQDILSLATWAGPIYLESIKCTLLFALASLLSLFTNKTFLYLLYSQ